VPAPRLAMAWIKPDNKKKKKLVHGTDRDFSNIRALILKSFASEI